ncbi:MAG: hypothetical protein KF886_12275 [Candidatus Hydrogenedentes bacterium]|nr:hypothetical protein [Candidatus Hydrogenedentota bacterium]
MSRNLLLAIAACAGVAAPALDLSRATVVVRGGDVPHVERTAVTVLVEEVERRTGIALPVAESWPASGPAIALLSGADAQLQGRPAPAAERTAAAEGYALVTAEDTLWIIGADPKGALYGVGRLLRNLDWAPGRLRLAAPLNLTTAPDDSIRGHQLGYRTTANSYDAWTPAQYDQYIRELALFGVNAIENIPFQDDDSPLMPVTRQVMNRALGESCRKYGVQYWVWTPATVDLTDPEKRAAHLAEHEAFYQESSHLDAVFFPGGDPGHNHPKDVMPFLEDLSTILAKHHPDAGIWMSLQGFDAEQVDYFFTWLEEHKPAWFSGAVGGPSSPPLPVLRARLPEQYRLRDYPDITHTVRSQYATQWIDPAFAFTSGREGTNPEPVYYSTIFRAFAQYTDGFITYSDGMHDDVNKTVWSLLGWDVDYDVRDGLIEYCRVFFGHDAAERAADGIYALERNWAGPLAINGGVEATLALWQTLEKAYPELRDNWRWQLCLLKAHYDAYIRARLIHEEKLEAGANAALAQAGEVGVEPAIDRALAILAKAGPESPRQELRAAIENLCERLFHSIGYQSSVPKYGANNAQRSAVLDFVDHPLNNRWWYEDQLAEIRALGNEAEQLARLKTIYTWENPGPGSFYDDIGNVAQSQRLLRGESLYTDPLMRRHMNPDFMWWDDGLTRVRQSWISKMDWPMGLRYDGLDPEADYVVRTTGYGQCLLRVNGERVTPTIDGKDIGEIKEFPVPRNLYQDGTIVLTFDVPHEPGINWRQMSRLSEVWLIKQ